MAEIFSFVTWYEAAAYCNALSDEVGVASCYQCAGSGGSRTCVVDPKYSATAKIYGCPGYRLPTEAEWEHAYRAGSETDMYNGNVTHALCGR